ncbi:group III truncated hemoglobin [Pollutibacter soli]|uniref:group III truncated hemoglobin n=1 Tax=Pollutibacter soli TaxID=3034157 RepID=UPI00301382AB
MQTETSKDIISIIEVQLLVNSFYEKVKQDPVLAPIFYAVIQDRWPHHLEKMYRFWQTVLLEEQTYFGAPFPPHANLPVTKDHFDRWLSLWYETIDQYFTGAKADEAKWRSSRMAEVFLAKIEYYRNNAAKPLI